MNKLFVVVVLALVAGAFAFPYEVPEGCPPKMAAMLKRTKTEPEAVVKDLMSSPVAEIVPYLDTARVTKVQPDPNGLPIVLAHGMGDSCFNSGMKQITDIAGQAMGVYSVCVPTGDTQGSDTMNGFFMTMNKNVDVFAAKVKKDPKLAGGFNAAGFSQGNSIIRGYIERYNDPPVHGWLSVHGTGMGVAGFPQCDPSGLLGPVCDILDEILGLAAYTSLSQSILFQANYYRDPMFLNNTAYKTHSQIADWNNENNMTESYKTNFESVSVYAMIRAMGDTMVWPNIGEWWGQYTPGQFKTEQTIKETDLYKQDLFGLRTVDEAGKIFYNSTKGNHLDFTEAQFTFWLNAYFK